MGSPLYGTVLSAEVIIKIGMKKAGIARCRLLLLWGIRHSPVEMATL